MDARCAVRVVAVAVLLAAVFFLGAPSAGAQGLCVPGQCQDFCVPGGTLTDSGCPEGKWIHRVCTPELENVNGGLVVFAHGYVAPDEPLDIPDYTIDGIPLSALVTQEGFVYATSSLPRNGLAIQEGIADLESLGAAVRDMCGLPGPILLAGASEGGAITALAMERSHVFWGGLALCGPIGSFQKQINHFGDFRVVFDYFFPNVLPGTAINPDPYPHNPRFVRDNWDSIFVPRIAFALQSNPAATAQLLKVMRVHVDPADPVTSAGEAVVGNLWYNVFATYDAQEKLGGQPFGNRWRFYTGSRNDFRLNLRVKRYRADYLAKMNIAALYETSGHLTAPVVTMHTTGDPIVPYWHEPFYRWKTWVSESGKMHCNLPVFKYGHCEFSAEEALTAFAILAYKVNAQGP
jgi:pimeloyl-ACP methyl ester carboxylesterase